MKFLGGSSGRPNVFGICVRLWGRALVAALVDHTRQGYQGCNQGPTPRTGPEPKSPTRKVQKKKKKAIF